MMTRRDLLLTIAHILDDDDRGSIADHDQAQREVIEELTAKVKNLTAWHDKMFGTPCEEIRHQQQVEQLEAKIEQQEVEIGTHLTRSLELQKELVKAEAIKEQQAKELEKLKGDICHWTLERYYQLEQENKALREALQALLTGKCGELLAERAPYSYKQAQQALKEVS